MSFIFSFITVCFLNYTITIILMLVAICSIIIPKMFKKRLANIQEEYSDKMKCYTAKIRGRLHEILEIKESDYKGVTPKRLPSVITLNNVTFSYNNSEVNAIKNLNLKFEEGKKYAIIGESGSGKSTIAKLLLNFYKCSEGKVKIDSEEILNINPNYLYHSISYIHQNVFLFDDTLRENITLYKDYSEDEIVRAIKLSGLWEFVSKLPNGIDTKVGENGSIFSGGERQRIGIARALICKSKFLILDEATSNLDNITAKNIYDSLLKLENTSSIIITHQLNTNFLSQCDYIYVMKNGHLIEEGTFKELLDSKKYFYGLYSINI